MTKTGFFKRGTALLVLVLMLLPLLCACGGKADPLAKTGFESITLTKKGGVVATLILSAADVAAHKGEYAYLYEIHPNEDPTTVALSGKTAIAQARISSEMKFKFDLYSGKRSRLLSGFAAYYADGSPITPTARAIDNPALLAPKTAAPLWNGTPKGVYVSDAEAAVALGTSHAVFSVATSDLGRPSSEHDTLRYTYAGTEYSVSRMELAELDRKILSAYRAGMQVTLELSVRMGELDENPQSEMLRRTALLDFLCARYSGEERGVLSAIVFGTWRFSADEMAQLASIAHRALLSRVAGGRIYVQAEGFTDADALRYFTDFEKALSKISDMPWGAAVEVDCGNPRAWDRAVAGLAPSVLPALHKDLSALPNSPAFFAAFWRGIDPLASNDVRAVDFAYCYAKAAEARADMIFFAEQDVLYNADGGACALTEIYRDIDVGLNGSQLRLCREVSGLDAVADAVAGIPVTRTLLYGVGGVGETGWRDKLLFDFSTGEMHGFTAVGASAAAKGSNPASAYSVAYGTDVLHTWLSRDKAQTGVRKTLADAKAFKRAETLSVAFLAQYGTEGIDNCRLILTLCGVDGSGEAILFEAEAVAPADKWQTAAFNVSAFSAVVDPESPVLMTLSVESEDGSAPAEDFGLWIHSVSVRKQTRDLTLLLVLLVSFAGVAVGFVLFFIIYRRQSKRADRKETVCHST